MCTGNLSTLFYVRLDGCVPFSYWIYLSLQRSGTSPRQTQIRQAIWDFEPRILPESVQVKVFSADNVMNKNSMTFDIEGDLWAQPLPLRLYLRTELDLETGNMSIIDKG